MFSLPSAKFPTVAALAVWLLSSLAAPHPAQAAGPSVRFVDAGMVRDFVVAEDELYVRWTSGSPADVRAAVMSAVPGATVLDSAGATALVKFAERPDPSKLLAGTDPLNAALPEATFAPVLYEAGLEREVANRRIFTATLLVGVADGRSPQQIGAMVGAVSAEMSAREGVAILKLPSASHVPGAIEVLTQAGIPANPLLAHSWEVAALPRDEFFKDQWHLLNTGQGAGLFGIDANVLDAWQVTLGSQVTIGIVDSCLETGHPDLAQNTPPVSSGLHHDFLDNDNDPNPHAGDRHGTAVAGIAAARQNNGAPNPGTGTLLGVSGVAPEARLIGLRLLAESSLAPTSDEDEAGALFWKPDGQTPIIDVSNNSWAPRTAALGLIGPDILALTALRNSVELGREGKGQVTVFAAGNGRLNGSEANLNGYANSRYVIAVGAIGNNGKVTSYSEPGANLLVSAPSDGGTLGIVTTDNQDVSGYNPSDPNLGRTDLPNTDYTYFIDGTSSATPVVSGVAALLLSVNPQLGWRDVKEILTSTARQVDVGDAEWFVNAAGFKFNRKYGGGLVDASAAVVRALDWTNLSQERGQEVKFPPTQLPQAIADTGTASTLNFNFSGPSYPNLRVETIEVTLDISHSSRSDLTISVQSPNATTETVLARNARIGPLNANEDYKYATFSGTGATRMGWTFTSVHQWGENSTGTWKVIVRDSLTNGKAGKINSASVRIYGTPSSPQRFKFEKARYTALEPDNPSSELEVAPKELKVTVQRLGPTVGTVTVGYATSTRGTAIPAAEGVANADYLPVSGTILFAEGETSKEISVPILHDAEPEGPESIYLLLKNPVGASLGGIHVATIDVVDNDANRVFIDTAASDLEAGETDDIDNNNEGTFVIRRTTAAPTPLQVLYTISGTAESGSDYENLVTLSATIPANEVTTTVTIRPVNDTTIEGDETVEITLLPNEASYQLGAPIDATVTIADNDRPTVQIAIVENQVLSEADPTRIATVRLTRTPNGTPADLTLPLVVRLDYESGNQVNGEQFENADALPTDIDRTLPEQVIIPSGQASLDLHIRALDDAIYQASKQIIVKLVANPENPEYNFGFLNSVTLTVIENDGLPDAKIPTLKLTGPKAGSRFVSPATVTVTGTASDNSEITAIEYRVNAGPLSLVPGVVPGTTVTWSLPLDQADLALGTNVVQIRSIDEGGNRSVTGVVQFRYVEEQPLTVTVTGGGTLTTGFAGTTIRERGVLYTITAKAAVGQVFKGWTGLRATVPADVDVRTLTAGNDTTPEVQQIDASAIFGAGSSFNLTFPGVTIAQSETTADILIPADATTIAARLNALPAITSIGGVTVAAGTAPGVFNISFNQPGDRLQIFGDGVRPSTSRTISFTLADLTGGTLDAEFIPTPFVPAILGPYSGLARQVQNPQDINSPVVFSYDSSGYLTLTPTAAGSFTGKLLLAGATLPFKGEFTGDGFFQGTIPRPGNLPLEVQLRIDLDLAGTQSLTGRIRSPNFLQKVEADRAAFGRTVPPPASVAGKLFTLWLPPNDPLATPAFDPRGNGYGTARIDALGNVKAAGVLGDGTKFTVSQPLTKDLTWPFFLQLYGKKGVVIGEVIHDPAQPDSDLHGSYGWFKPALARDRYFPLGFNILESDILGSLYTVQPGRALSGFADTPNNATITLSDGNLGAPIDKLGTLSAANLFTISNPGSTALTLKINATAGTFTGSFFHPVALKRTTVNGVLFQKQNKAVGAFLGLPIPGVPGAALQTGKVTIAPAP